MHSRGRARAVVLNQLLGAWPDSSRAAPAIRVRRVDFQAIRPICNLNASRSTSSEVIAGAEPAIYPDASARGSRVKPAGDEKRAGSSRYARAARTSAQEKRFSIKTMNVSDLFHPAVADWFGDCFTAPTPAQAGAWPAIKAGQHTLIAAPTGSGKTLAAFLAAIDSLICQGLSGDLGDETQVVYVSPLKALSNDIHRNLEVPLAGIREQLRDAGLPDVDIRTWVRTGDTPSAERDRARRRPPHIVVTTPESLYILLGSESGRAMLRTTRTVVVDEIHAVAPNKRGSHLAISLERLAALCGDRLQRIGLSATQKPIEAVAHFLVGADAKGEPAAPCTIVDTGHRRARDLALEVPLSPLESVMSAEVWEQVYDRIADLIEAHRTTLVFVNTRRLSERVTRQ